MTYDCVSASVYFDDHDNDNHRHYYYSVVARTYALATYPFDRCQRVCPSND